MRLSVLLDLWLRISRFCCHPGSCKFSGKLVLLTMSLTLTLALSIVQSTGLQSTGRGDFHQI